MKKELNAFFAALVYYSRLPAPAACEFSEQALVHGFRYFPLVGILIGGLAALIFLLSSAILPGSISLLIAMAAVMLLTGCLHEDGFADFFDGFGGGTSQESILNIMKDSHIGTYGVVALILLVAFKFTALLAVPVERIPYVLIAAHGISRVYLLFLVKSSVYARQGQSKAQHTRSGISHQTLLVGSLIGTAPLVFCNGAFLYAFLPLSLLGCFVYRQFLHRRIGGFTGDTLGALQQGMEVLFYLTYIAFQ